MPDTNKNTKQIKSKQRVADHGEVFTAPREVNAMLDLVKNETERIDSRFLEPACGDGNFLAEILHRKLTVVAQQYAKSQNEYELYSIIALSSIYGIDILADNVADCRNRLLQIFTEKYTQIFSNNIKNDYVKTAQYILLRNILWGDALTLCTPNAEKTPIIFSEWTCVNTQGMIKRRDFKLDTLMKNQPIDEPNIFSDLGDQAFIPMPIKVFELKHFLKLYEYEN